MITPHVNYVFWWQVIGWTAVTYNFSDRWLTKAWVNLSSQHIIMTDERCKNTMITARSTKGINTQRNAWHVSKLVDVAEEDWLETTPRSIKGYSEEVWNDSAVVSTFHQPTLCSFLETEQHTVCPYPIHATGIHSNNTQIIFYCHPRHKPTSQLCALRHLLRLSHDKICQFICSISLHS